MPARRRQPTAPPAANRAAMIIIGSVVSASFIALLVVGIIVMSRGKAQAPTDASGPEALAPLTYPDNLPTFYTPIDATTPANAHYDDALSYAISNRRKLVYRAGEQPDSGTANHIADLLIRGMNAKQVNAPMFDDRLPMQPNPTPDYGDSLEWMIDAAKWAATDAEERGNTDRAKEITHAIFAFGQRLYENNKRFYHRVTGWQTMTEAINMLYMFSEDGSDDEKLYKDLYDQMYAQWQRWDKKLNKVVKALRPNFGDLIRIAENDGDVGVRIMATMQLGIAKFAKSRGEGNDAAIRRTIEKLKEDDEPLVAEAAKAAEAFTAEDVRRQ